MSDLQDQENAVLDRLRKRKRKIETPPQLGDPLDNYQGKWRNYYFSRKDETVVRASTDYDTPSAASTVADRTVAQLHRCQALYPSHILSLSDGVSSIDADDLSHHLQLPAGL